MATQSYVQKVRSGRLVQPFGYAAGTVVTNPVTLRGPVYTEWYLRLRGTLTSSAAIAAANVNPGDEWAVVNRVRLLAGIYKGCTGDIQRFVEKYGYEVRYIVDMADGKLDLKRGKGGKMARTYVSPGTRGQTWEVVPLTNGPTGGPNR